MVFNMDYRYATKRALGYDGGLRAFMLGIFNKMFLALGVTGAVAWMVSTNFSLLRALSGGTMWLLFFAQIGIAGYLSLRLHKMQVSTAFNLFFAYAVLTGVAFAPICLVYTGESIAITFLTTASFFGTMSLIGYTTKKDLTSFGTFFSAGLLALCFVSVLNALIFRSSGISMALAFVGIVVFAGLTAYDVQNLKKIYNYLPHDENLAKYSVFGAFQLYLDFINMFIYLLRFLGNRRN